MQKPRNGSERFLERFPGQLCTSGNGRDGFWDESFYVQKRFLWQCFQWMQIKCNQSINQSYSNVSQPNHQWLVTSSHVLSCCLRTWIGSVQNLKRFFLDPAIGNRNQSLIYWPFQSWFKPTSFLYRYRFFGPHVSDWQIFDELQGPESHEGNDC